jgi:hypothetical protein
VARDNFGNAPPEARTAVAEESTAWQALVRFLRQSQELRLTVQLALARTILQDDLEADELRRAMIEVLDGVVHAAQAEGTLRTDIDTGDVAMMFVLLVRQLPVPFEEAARLAPERCMTLMLDGLRAQPGADLPVAP